MAGSTARISQKASVEAYGPPTRSDLIDTKSEMHTYTDRSGYLWVKGLKLMDAKLVQYNVRKKVQVSEWGYLHGVNSRSLGS